MFRTWHGFTLLVLLTCFKNGQLEDVVVARGGRLTVTSLCSSRELRLDTAPLRDVSAMTYDAATGRLLLSAVAAADGTHQLWTAPLTDNARPQPVTFSGAPPGRLEGLVVSADHSALFATDATNGTIVHVPLAHVLRRTAAVSVLHMLPDDRPRGLAVDETSQLLFWTNWRFGRQSVERSGLDGSERARLIDSDLYLPAGVAADAASSAVYFSDAGVDGRLRVERAAQDGSERHVLYRGRHPQATGLQLAAGSLYWSDVSGVWRLPLAGDSAAAAAELVVPLPGRPSAMLVLREDEQCTSYTPIVPTAASAEVARPADSACDNYCVVGRCRWDELRGRTCRCPPGYSGRRCERDHCHNYCLGGGTCHRDAGGDVLCACPEGTTGDRCQHANSAAAAAASEGSCDPSAGLSCSALRLVISGLLAVLALMAGVLVICGLRLRRAARTAAANALASPTQPQRQTKKRFVAVGKQLRPRPQPARPDIEDCCQMTLCETPCVVSVAACERQGLVDQKNSGCDNPQALADLF